MTEEIKEIRKLASIRRIAKIEPIEGADKIVMATVDGWKLVTAIDNGFKENDLVIYFEIDSWIPHEIAPFLSKGKEPREFEGVKGERLRTIKLRGQVSQGLIIPLDTFYSTDGFTEFPVEEGTNLTELLNIKKYEKPVPTKLGGKVKRYFPSFIRKTDQERAQNIPKDIFEAHKETQYEITMKLDGSSMTVYNRYVDETEIESGVCSRNLELKLDQEGNSFVDFAKNSGLLSAIENSGVNVAIQGELMGEGIQGNRERLTGYHFYLYDIWNIDKQCYMGHDERVVFFNSHLKDLVNVHHVPLIEIKPSSLNDIGVTNMEELLDFAEGESINNHIREGVVFKAVDGGFSFKVISNNFLTKEK